MAYFTPEEIKAARDMDLLTYLKNYDPGNLVKVAGNTYCTREHDSLRISNGKWCWFSQNMGGKSALDYLIKVQGMTFIQAVENIIGHSAARAPIRYESAFKEKKQLLLPERNSNNEAVKRYLQGRGIHAVIIDYCTSHDLLYESEKYHIPEPERVSAEKSPEERFVDELMQKPVPNREEGQTQNPTEGRVTKSRQSEPTSPPKGSSARGSSEPERSQRPSVKKELEEIKASQRKTADTAQRAKTPQQSHQHKAPKKKKTKGMEK